MPEQVKTHARRGPGPERPSATEPDPIAYPFIGRSKQVKTLLELVMQVADTDATVLVSGESGTGKELIARRLHTGSSRHNAPFVAINCGAVTESLLEAELFGHTRGAFTGAEKPRAGRFEAAHRGTIFLDELVEMCSAFQVALLRILQTGEYTPVGTNECRYCDVRVIAATNSDLAPLIDSKRFRHDLFYRLNIIRIDIPPLRERREDIVPLVEHFLKVYGDRYRRTGLDMAAEAYDILHGHNFPGNVRELENLIHRAVLLAAGCTIQAKDLPSHLHRTVTGPRTGTVGKFHDARKVVLRAFEEAFLRDALRDCGGIVSRAARQTGLSERNFHKKMTQYNLDYRAYRI